MTDSQFTEVRRIYGSDYDSDETDTLSHVVRQMRTAAECNRYGHSPLNNAHDGMPYQFIKLIYKHQKHLVHVSPVHLHKNTPQPALLSSGTVRVDNWDSTRY